MTRPTKIDFVRETLILQKLHDKFRHQLILAEIPIVEKHRWGSCSKKREQNIFKILISICSQGLPEAREWKVGTQMAWVPEKSDFPIFGEPTNWGLAQSKIADWHKENCKSATQTGQTDFTTTHKYFYGKVPEQTRVDRFYIGRSLNKQKSTVLPITERTANAMATAAWCKKQTLKNVRNQLTVVQWSVMLVNIS